MNKAPTLHFCISILGIVWFNFFSLETTAQCSFNTNVNAVNLGTITPTETWQTTGCVSGGDYFIFNAVMGQHYAFTFCDNGGTAPWDSELSINTNAGDGVPYAYNDDFCGVQSQIIWIAIANGTFAIYATGYSCTNNIYCATLAYRIVTPTPPTVYALSVQTDGNNSNAEWLVPNVFLNGCSEVSNITYTGHPSAIGYFTNGESIGIPEGIIISSGAVINAEGTNNSDGIYSQFEIPGDPDLTALTISTPCGSPSPTFDAAVIEFTFVPVSTSVQFQYVFASEEYPEYVCASFNDVFGLFISGPGVQFQNLALIPDTGIYVGINTVNPINNNVYYNSNPTGSIITQFDGYTDVMTAVATGLTPCQTYTIKLAVADAGDHILDSAVFLAANSFDTGNVTSVSVTGMQDAIEGYTEGYFEFFREDISDLSQPVTFEIIVTGTAMPGEDYEPLPNIVTIPSGQISIQVPVFASTDELVEGTETIVVQIDQFQCDCTSPLPAQILIHNSDPFIAFINNPEPICLGQQATLTASASGSDFTPYTYTWSTGQTGETISVSPLFNTIYSVTVTDANGFTTSSNVSVTVLNITPPSMTPISICSGNCVTLNAGPGFTSYSWSSGGTSQNLNVCPLTTSSFTVTVTDANGCTASSTVLVTVNNITPPTIAPQTICIGNCVTLSAGTGFTSYLWSTGGTSQNITACPFTTSSYTVTVTDANGCTASSNVLVTVNNITPPAIAPQTICIGDCVSLNAGTGFTSYSWSTGGVSQNLNVCPLTTSSYTVTVADANGCTASTTVLVTVNNITPPAIAPQTICSGSSVTLNAGTYTAYSWSTGVNGQSLSVSPTTTTTYIVTVSNSYGCTASSSTTVTVLPSPNVLIEGSSSFCIGSSATISATPGFSDYIWSDGGSSQSITVNSSGNYSVTVTDLNGCTASVSMFVSQTTSLSPTIYGNLSLCGSETTTLTLDTNYGEYFWSNGENTPEITVSEAGTYSVTVSDGLDCTGFDSVDITVSPQPVANISTLTPFVCEGETVSLSGSGGTTYYWTGQSGFVSTEQNPVISNITPENGGEYTLIVTDANGCQSNPAIIYIEIMPAPELNLLSPGTLCSDEILDLELLLNGSTTIGTWAGTGVVGNQFFAGEVSAGNYQIVYTIPEDGICPMFSSAISLTVAPEIIFSDHYCIPVSGGYQVFFNTWGGAPPYNISGNTISDEGETYSSGLINAASYSFLVTDSNGCSKLVTGNDTDCNVDCMTETIGTISPIDDVCNNAFTISLTSAPPPPYTYSIDGENWQESETFTNLEIGDYYVYVQHSCGNSIIGAYQAQNSLFSATIGLEQTPEGDSIAVVNISGGNPPYQYLWSTIGLGVDTLSNPQLPLTVLVSDVNGCEVTLSLTDPTTSIGEPTQEINHINIYPNPSNGVIYIESERPTNSKVVVFDAFGREVLVGQTDFMEVVKLDLENKGSGMFFISIQTSDAHIFRKILLY